MSESYSITAVLQAKVDGLVSGFKQATSTVDNFVKKNEQTFKSFKQVGAAATAGGVAVASGLGFAVKKASDFQTGMSSVAAVSGATGKDLEMLTQTAREWGASTSFSATEAAAGLEKLALAGWDTQQMMGGIGPVLHLAEAGNLALDRSAELVTNSMGAMKIGVGELTPYLDKVAAAASNADTDIDQLMEAFVVSGGTFERLNIPLEESAAMLGIMANNGFKGSEAGTAMNAIMSRLTSSTGPAADALKEMGVNAFDAEGNFRGMETVMMEVSKELEGMTDKERENALEKIAGLNHGKAFNAMLDVTGDKYAELKGEITESNGALEGMRDIMKDNLGGDIENLMSAFEEMAIAIGTTLIPHVRTFIEFVQSLLDKFNSLDEKTMTIIALIATLSAGFLLLVGPILMLVGFIPSMLAGFTALSTVIGAIVSPVGLAVAALVAIGAALVVAYNEFEWFRNMVNTVWDAIVSVIKSAIEGIASFVNNIATQITTYWTENGELIRSATENVWSAIQTVIETVMPIIEGVISAVWFVIQTIVLSVWENIKSVISGALDIILGLVKTFSGLLTGDFSAMWEGVKQMFSGAVEFLWNLVQLMLWGRLLKGLSVFVNSFRSVISSMWTTIRSLFTSAINAIRSFFTSGFNAMRNVANTSMSSIRSLISSIWSAIRNTFTTVVNGIKNVVSNGFNNVVTTIRTNMTNAVSAVRNAVSRFFNAGKDLIQGLINGIKNMGAKAIGAITGVVDGVVNKAKSLLRIKSPSRVFEDIGQFTGEGLAIGISKRKRSVEKAIKGVAETVTKIAKTMNKDINTDTQKANAEIKKIEKRAQQDINLIHTKAKKAKRKLTQSENIRIQRIEEDTAEKVKKIKEKNVSDIQKVEEQSYKKIEEIRNKINDRASSLYGFAGIFDEVSNNAEISSDKLISNLDSQVKIFEKWANNIENLSRRGIEEGLLEELREMGPKAAAEIDALNRMTDSRLSDYVGLWKKKNRLAGEQALSEFSNINNRVNDVNRSAGKQLAYVFDSEVNVDKQPAYINLILGGREYNAFVENITETQERTKNTNLKFI